MLQISTDVSTDGYLKHKSYCS